MGNKGRGWRNESHRHRLAGMGIPTIKRGLKSTDRLKRDLLIDVDGYILEKDKYGRYYVIRPDLITDSLYIDLWGNIFYDDPHKIPDNIMSIIETEIREDLEYDIAMFDSSGERQRHSLATRGYVRMPDDSLVNIEMSEEEKEKINNMLERGDITMPNSENISESDEAIRMFEAVQEAKRIRRL